jgi:nucleoside recognition membrane protein YjiH
MAQTVEISLRIPSLRVRREGKEDPETIANGDVRFIKQVELTAIPKAGESLTMTVGSSDSFACEVVRSDWQNDKNMFVIACRYSKRSISLVEYQALMDAPDWQVRPLL